MQKRSKATSKGLNTSADGVRRVEGSGKCVRTVCVRLELFDPAAHEKLAATPAAIRACAPVLRKVADRGNVCVFGNEDIIRAAKQPLEVTKLF